MEAVVQAETHGARVSVKYNLAVRRGQFFASLIQRIAQFQHNFPSSGTVQKRGHGNNLPDFNVCGFRADIHIVEETIQRR